MKALLPLAAALALAGCITVYPPDKPVAAGLVYARLGQVVTVGGPRVTPLAVLEDSRCPAGVQCVWAGRVRLSVRIGVAQGATMREMVAGMPLAVAEGTLTLVDVLPEPRRDSPARPEDYRFGFRFDGGL